MLITSQRHFQRHGYGLTPHLPAASSPTATTTSSHAPRPVPLLVYSFTAARTTTSTHSFPASRNCTPSDGATTGASPRSTTASIDTSNARRHAWHVGPANGYSVWPCCYFPRCYVNWTCNSTSEPVHSSAEHMGSQPGAAVFLNWVLGRVHFRSYIFWSLMHLLHYT